MNGIRSKELGGLCGGDLVIRVRGDEFLLGGGRDDRRRPAWHGHEALAEARDPELIAITWITGAAKFVAGFFALMLVLPAGRRFPRWLLRLGAWGGGILLTLYGLGNLIQHLLMATGASPIAELLGTAEALHWHLLVWDPIWILGGLFFLAAAWHYHRVKSDFKGGQS